MRLRKTFLACAFLYPALLSAQIFEFHSGFWLNLHQFLFHEAAQKSATPSDSAEWQAAVEYYRREVVPRGEMSEELTAVNNRLSEAGSSADLPAAGPDPGLYATLQKAAPVYRRVWWSQHNQSNITWIEAVRPLAAKYGDAIKKDIAAAYMTEWPGSSIRVDVSAYGGPFGAYTTARPTPHITISSTDPSYQGMASLEMLFHETSHTLDDHLQEALRDALQSRHALFQRRGFEHAIIFYTAGALVRRYVPGYESYASRNGIWTNGWPGALAVLEKNWQPYLDGKIDFATAVRGMVTDYGVPNL